MESGTRVDEHTSTQSEQGAEKNKGTSQGLAKVGLGCRCVWKQAMDTHVCLSHNERLIEIFRLLLH